MNHHGNQVYLLNNLSQSDVDATPRATQLRSLLDLLGPVATTFPKLADYIIGFSDQETWPPLGFQSHSGQTAFLWLDRFMPTKLYEAVISDLPQVIFFHGEHGIVELRYLLEEAFVVDPGCRADPLAEDAFLRMRGEYIIELEADLAHLHDSGKVEWALWEAFVDRIAGSAGTYEFEALSDLAIRALEASDQGRRLYPDQLMTELERVLAEERETYNRRIEESLPAAVELDVRQRVLVLADDPQVANQLQFALSHSRMQTSLVTNPAELPAFLEGVQPDILVIQQALRHFDGLDIAAHVRHTERFQSLPILALLSEASEPAITRAIRVGVDSWLAIPFSAANVALSVLNLLHRVEAARKLGGRDHLTGLYTKEAMRDRLEGDLLRMGRSGQQLAVMLIHLRNAESPRADFLRMTDVAKRAFRRTDTLARYNESTLAVVLPAIDARIAVSIFNRFRHMLDDGLTVESATSLAGSTATADSLLADVEIRLTRALGGSVDTALGIFDAGTNDERALRSVPRILIADTDDAIIKLLRFFCVREGFEVDDVRNGTDVLEYLDKQALADRLPELLVLESFLPGVDGFHILERVQTAYSGRIAVIMLSVRPSEERVAKAFKLGAIDFVAKPFRVPEMIARIRNGLIRTCAV